mmetsp:Transcript_16822/g.14750  ORF Transcript_16822/g.14750 Transcript_16822/m.14750 type:complete len:203 (-) Transcript_16822:3-611(-)
MQILREKNEERMQEIEQRNKLIYENLEQIAELEDKVEECKLDQAQRDKAEGKIRTELDNIIEEKKTFEKDLELKSNTLKKQVDQNKNKLSHHFKLIEEKQKLTGIYKRKIELIETHFSKAELFLLKMLAVNEKLGETPNIQGNLFEQSNTVENSKNLESLKMQHKTALLGVREFYSSFDLNLEPLVQKREEEIATLEDIKSA